MSNAPEVKPKLRKRTTPPGQVTLRLKPSLKAEIDLIAQEIGQSTNGLLVEFIAFALQKYKEAHPK